MAASLDGFIARADGSFDDFPWDDDYLAALLAMYPETFPAPMREGSPTRADNRRFDTVLMGRATYEVGLNQGLSNPYPTLDQYLFSRRLEASPDPAVTLVSSNAVAFVSDLKKRDGAAIWICGGSQLAGAFFEAGLVDEVIVKVNPVFFGTGIPLFDRRLDVVPLRPIQRHEFDSGHLILKYAVDP